MQVEAPTNIRFTAQHFGDFTPQTPGTLSRLSCVCQNFLKESLWLHLLNRPRPPFAHPQQLWIGDNNNNSNNNNNNNNVLSADGSGYFTFIQNMKLVTNKCLPTRGTWERCDTGCSENTHCCDCWSELATPTVVLPVTAVKAHYSMSLSSFGTYRQ